MPITSEGGNALCAGGSGVLSRLVGPGGVSWLWWGTCLTCARGQVPRLWRGEGPWGILVGDGLVGPCLEGLGSEPGFSHQCNGGSRSGLARSSQHGKRCYIRTANIRSTPGHGGYASIRW